MNISGEAKLISTALIKARSAMNATVAKDGEGNYGKYATLAAIVEATTDAFVANGLAVVQEVGTDEHGVTVETWLVHESGATMEFKPLTLPLSQRTPQAVGSAITYGRRYALAAICGLAPDDDDGQAAQDATDTKPQRQHAPKTAQKPQETQEDKKTPDTTLNRLAPEQGAIIAHLGKSAYGDEWDDNMNKLAQWASQGARSQLGELREIEAEKLIKALKKRIEQQNEAIAA